ncbi:helix-turn-helix transcriptional regulator [Marinimicrobium sp. ABcell2]|uniref:helix-turn-helix transcriptional regulator n=1 Tax=Marinimicrobium sp. ABcell2 TaxID=3069751 RepID=UPI0027B032BB|nr:helix-turn-helix transcriptional regulator [Marinimicrobium sp. ABcell2]MDQ2077490.1 helix-turn-helix transcriptional regulator [Marinimicrobium sp. ABcell2]
MKSRATAIKSRTGAEREALVNSLLAEQIQGRITYGDMLRQLRIELTGMTQAEFASLAGISRRSLTQLENDGSNPTVAVFGRAFRPFGLRVGFTPMGSTKERLEAIAQTLDIASP